MAQRSMDSMFVGFDSQNTSHYPNWNLWVGGCLRMGSEGIQFIDLENSFAIGNLKM